jgi:DNA-directed RNA polymerase subunit RPC12/RpoP
MRIESLGEAWSNGWKLTARCVRGRKDDTRSKSSRECPWRFVLDMETLVATRGRDFPLSRLESRLRCPRCGNRRIVILFEPPRERRATAAP